MFLLCSYITFSHLLWSLVKKEDKSQNDMMAITGLTLAYLAYVQLHQLAHNNNSSMTSKNPHNSEALVM